MLRYPREGNPDVVRAYAEDLVDLQREEVVQACRHLIRTSKFLPAVSEIRDEVTAIRRHARERRETRAILTAPDPSPEERERVKGLVGDLLSKIGRPLADIARPIPEAPHPDVRREELRMQHEALQRHGKA